MQGMITMTEQEYQRAIEEAREKAIQTRKRCRSVYMEVMDEFNGEFDKFRRSGLSGDTLRNSIGAILRAAMDIKYNVYLPEDRKEEAIQIVQSVFDIISKPNHKNKKER